MVFPVSSHRIDTRYMGLWEKQETLLRCVRPATQNQTSRPIGDRLLSELPNKGSRTKKGEVCREADSAGNVSSWETNHQYSHPRPPLMAHTTIESPSLIATLHCQHFCSRPKKGSPSIRHRHFLRNSNAISWIIKLRFLPSKAARMIHVFLT